MKRLIYICCIAAALFAACKSTEQNQPNENIEQNYPTPGLRPINEYDKEADYYRANAANSYAREEYDLALDNFRFALIRDKMIDNQTGIALTHNSMGTIYLAMGDYSNSLTNFLAAQAIYSNIKDTGGLADTYLNLGRLYFRQNDFQDSIAMYNYSIRYYEVVHNDLKLANAHNSIGMCYLKLSNYPEALSHFYVAREKNERNREYRQLSANHNNLGETYLAMSSNASAIRHFRVAYVIDVRLEDPTAIGTDLYNLGRAYEADAGSFAHYRSQTNAAAASNMRAQYYDKINSAYNYYERALAVYSSALEYSDTAKSRDLVKTTLKTLIRVAEMLHMPGDARTYTRQLEALQPRQNH